MKPTADEVKLGLMFSQLRLPSMKQMWPSFAERSDREGWPAAQLLGAVIFHFVLGGAFQIISEAVGQFVSHCAVSILRDELESPVFFPRRDFWAQF